MIKKQKYFVHDVEVFPNFFCVAIREVGTDQIIMFEISDRVNELEQLQEFYNNRVGDFVIGFNSLDFDDMFINVLLKANTVTNSQLYSLGQKLIKLEKWWDSPFKDYRYSKWHTVDLFRFWSKMLRLSKNLSLKSLGIQMNYPVTMDLPYAFDKYLSHKEMDHVREYNIHDINITELLFEKKRKEFDMRMDVYNEHGLQCFAWDDPKIAMKLLKIAYEKETGNDFSSLRQEHNSIKISDILLPKVVKVIKEKLPLKKKTDEYYPSVRNYLKDLEKMTVSSMGEISAKIVTPQLNGMKLESILGSGGIHSTAFKGILEPKEDECILDVDYSSYYPSLIEILGGLGDALPTYSKIKETRLLYKALLKTDISSSEYAFYDGKQSRMKLQINGTFGMLNNQYSDIYNLKDALSTTVNGQLILQMLSELVIKRFDCSVVYSNTDGSVIVCKKKDKDLIKKFLEDVSTYISPKLILEYEEFSKMILSNVNNFINVTTSGKLKKKGKLFLTKTKLGDSVDQLVVPKALEAYYVYGTPIDEFIRNHDNIFDFCVSKKSNKKYTVYHNGKPQQRLNRYYMSKNGAFLYKSKDGKKMINMHKGQGVTMYNVHKNTFPNDIDYLYYRRECYKIINDLDLSSTNPNGKQFKLFQNETSKKQTKARIY